MRQVKKVERSREIFFLHLECRLFRNASLFIQIQFDGKWVMHGDENWFDFTGRVFQKKKKKKKKGGGTFKLALIWNSEWNSFVFRAIQEDQFNRQFIRLSKYHVLT